MRKCAEKPNGKVPKISEEEYERYLTSLQDSETVQRLSETEKEGALPPRTHANAPQN